MGKSESQVQAFHHELVELVKKYQFRDRNQITCNGISVSQCYVLEVLHFKGSLTMQSLAEQMHLSISTVTRVVEGLVQKGYINRKEDEKDRRVRRVALTQAGEKILQACLKNVMESERAILQQFPAKNRDMLIKFLRKLNQAVSCWQARA